MLCSGGQCHVEPALDSEPGQSSDRPAWALLVYLLCSNVRLEGVGGGRRRIDL